MRQTEGLLVFFDEEQRNELLKAGQDAGIESFTDALTIPDLAIRTSRVAALSFSETTLDFLSLVTKGKQVVTSKSRVEFSELLDLKEISFNEISFRLKENLHQYFVRSSSGRGKRIPQKTWEKLIDIIKILRPHLAGDIDRLETLGLYSGFHLTGNDADYLLQQREALGTALDIFSGSSKLRSQVLRGWAPPTDSITNINEKTETVIWLLRLMKVVTFLRAYHRVLSRKSRRCSTTSPTGPAQSQKWKQVTVSFRWAIDG